METTATDFVGLKKTLAASSLRLLFPTFLQLEQKSKLYLMYSYLKW